MHTTAPELSRQRQLSDFLNAELLHTLGAYRRAAESFKALQENIELGVGSHADTTMHGIVTEALTCNEHLRNDLHRSDRPPHPEEDPKDDDDLLKRISHFYDAAASSLNLHLDAMEAGAGASNDSGRKLGAKLALIHDPQRSKATSEEHAIALGRGREARMRDRLKKANDLQAEPPQALGNAAGFQTILDDHMGLDPSSPGLHLTVLEAMSEAHVRMHRAERLRSHNFETTFTTIPSTHVEVHKELRRSLVLNTFVFVASQTVPWIFAEDWEERDHVLSDYENCCETLTPTYCMWIGSQLSLLALHRRAYTWWTMGKPDRAYRDFYKLTRFARGMQQRVEQRGVRVPGTRTLIEGLTASAEHHIGRIYRGQHAHRLALKYFDRASLHFKGWEDHVEIGHILRNSRWRLNLLVSQGKANYELGRMTRSLLCYARAWRAFLLLAETESHSTANLDIVKGVIEWLASIKGDPELSKTELAKRLEPLVSQFKTVRSPVHLRLLAADIMMRLGHLLFILKLPPEDWKPTQGQGQPTPDHELARRCLIQAASLDRHSTLIAADLLKIRHATRRTKPRGDEPSMASLKEQWPSGGGRFEEAARVIEYTLQGWLGSSKRGKSGDGPEVDREIARELLGSFLAHTDSSNVKLAQVYRYLMQEPRGLKRNTDPKATTLDLVCLRRYSSFFPFLPRPAAFRAPGGGYFVQVRETGEKTKPFGIAIDPGPDFLHNLYRCGYGLADIQMIVITHDHADHMASVDALLALMGTRMSLGEETFEEGKCLTIVGNDSVYERYSFFNDPHPVKTRPPTEEEVKAGATGEVPAERADFVRVLTFAEFQTIAKATGGKREGAVKKREIYLPVKSLRIEPVKTIDHYDATGNPAQGFLLSIGQGKSRSKVLFTGDTGPPPSASDPAHYVHHFAKGTKSLETAVAEADVVVAHLSSVPLRELRMLAELAPDQGQRDEATDAFLELWAEARERAEVKSEDELERKGIKKTRFLLSQLQFGFRSRARSKEKDEQLKVSPFSPIEEIKGQSEKHLYLTGLLALAKKMAASQTRNRPPLLLIGELREELGTFRTRIASRITEAIFKPAAEKEAGANGDPDLIAGTALTADIGLRVRLSKTAGGRKQRSSAKAVSGTPSPKPTSVLCTTCDLDNDLIPEERFHPPDSIREVCVKGEDEGVFYNCLLHDPGQQAEQPWVQTVERYDPFDDLGAGVDDY